MALHVPVLVSLGPYGQGCARAALPQRPTHWPICSPRKHGRQPLHPRARPRPRASPPSSALPRSARRAQEPAGGAAKPAAAAATGRRASLTLPAPIATAARGKGGGVKWAALGDEGKDGSKPCVR